MTDKEKAEEIAEKNKIVYCAEDNTSKDECRKSALDMAQWKDAQFKEYLEKKKADNPLVYRSDWGSCENNLLHNFIDELINEFFESE